MTNEEIIDKNSPLHEVEFSYRRTLELMQLARQDERKSLKDSIGVVFHLVENKGEFERKLS